jgi:hypothetical protein
LGEQAIFVIDDLVEAQRHPVDVGDDLFGPKRPGGNHAVPMNARPNDFQTPERRHFLSL